MLAFFKGGEREREREREKREDTRRVLHKEVPPP